tara:strand:- start:5397 stop:6044 length:648 start_codon:yes stop_codon:yes gene_type:complete
MNMSNQKMRNFSRILGTYLILISSFFLTSCGGWDPQSTREVPVSGPERAKKNVAEGRGLSLKNLGKSGSTTYEFSTSNPMWRATFDVIDFMPLVTVDYSGGLIITDWYSDSKAPNESLKFTIRFLSSELRADSIKVIVHRKVCSQQSECIVKKMSSKLEGEIRTAIVRRAALIVKDEKSGTKKKEEKKKKKKKGFFGFGSKDDTQDEKSGRESGS